mmetsp:Transcript_5463/g.16129  ORF Transcript_5463/g.16129 Transcript_5463/m.16129 type:complete len:227 (-) Transcript_5463:2990-3670(-)
MRHNRTMPRLAQPLRLSLLPQGKLLTNRRPPSLSQVLAGLQPKLRLQPLSQRQPRPLLQFRLPSQQQHPQLHRTYLLQPWPQILPHRHSRRQHLLSLQLLHHRQHQHPFKLLSLQPHLPIWYLLLRLLLPQLLLQLHLAQKYRRKLQPKKLPPRRPWKSERENSPPWRASVDEEGTATKRRKRKRNQKRRRRRKKKRSLSQSRSRIAKDAWSRSLMMMQKKWIASS